MDTSELDWSLIAAFLAVAEEGSLSAAARKLGQSQPTLGRKIRELEDRLGLSLFHRQPRGLALTEAGADLLPAARSMGEAMRQIALTAGGRQARLEGPVRITASDVVSFYHLGPILRKLREDAPGISVDLAASDQTSNLLFREADIAIRMFRPTQLDLVAKYLGEIELGCFAAKSYVARRGLPESPDDMRHHDFIGYDRSTALIDGFRERGMPVTREFFALRCDDNLAGWALVRAGCGIGFGQAVVGRADPLLQELPLGFPLPTLPVWLTAHEAMRRTHRVRHVWEALERGLSALVMPHAGQPA
jgi:DNA-binding transcriptional LysR family regulator